MKSEKVEFDGAFGDRLSGRLDQPDGNVSACALFAHCFTCSKNLKAVGNITKALAGKGIETLRFDFTGLGESEGDFADTNFSSNVDDLIAASEYLEVNRRAPTILIGHSLGGAAVLQAAHRLKSVKAVVTIGAPSEPKHVEQHFESKREEIEKTGEAIVNLAGRPFKVKKQFLDDLTESRMDQYIENLDRALLVMHAPLDQTVGIQNAAHIYKKAKHPKSFLSLYQADHLLMDEKYSRYTGSIIAEWATIYLPE
ncbi:MAG: alpha/beta fold hydrolase [Balneolaceae bacterium]